jgi:hypothetical protein
MFFYRFSFHFTDLVTVEHVEFNGYGRFPENVDVVLGNQGNNVYLKLARDDDATSILSEEIFETSKILPTGVFSEHDKDVSKYNYL